MQSFAPEWHRVAGRFGLSIASVVVVSLLSLLAVSLPPTLSIAVVAAVLAIVVIIVLRLGPLELIIATMPVSFYGQLGSTVNLSVSDIFLLLLVARIFLDRSIWTSLGIERRRITHILACALMLFAVMSVGVLVSSAISPALAWNAYLLDALKIVIVILYLVAALVAFSTKIRSGDLRFLGVWTWTAVIVAALGIVGSLLWARGIDTGLTMNFRATSTFQDPNAYATYLLLSVGVVMLWSWRRRGRILCWQLLPIFVGIYLSYSRASLFATAVMLLVGFGLSIRNRNLRAFGWISAITLIVAGIFVAGGDLASLVDPNRGISVAGDTRFTLWAAAIKAWQSSPLLGVGLGQFEQLSSAAFGSSLDSLDLVAHNTYLSFLAEGGVVGLLLFLAIPGPAFISLVRCRDTGSRLLLLSMVSCGVMAASLNLQNFRPLWILLALVFAMWDRVGLRSSTQQLRDGRSPAGTSHAVLAERERRIAAAVGRGTATRAVHPTEATAESETGYVGPTGR